MKGTLRLYEQLVEFWFDAAHSLRGYEGTCARLHGHGYRVQVALRGDRLDDAGMLMDFRQVKAVCREVIDRLDHVYLNEVVTIWETPTSAVTYAPEATR